ncbi:MAG: sugar phosphate isomerase/epimerase [Verrucomicrobiae bacterium]|nr:sugar phosphate isomerase/epimerase [Verrucomicrobiae bacterium]MCP5523575.1 sugar phosphate isomerase/epimerase [Verrucomicrobiales bacterium]
MKTPISHLFAVATAAALLGAGTVLAESTVGTGPKFKGPVGLQLYSLRDSFNNDVPGTLDKVKALGFKYVELAGTYGLAPAEFKRMLAERGLVPVAAHFSLDLYQKDIDSIIRDAKTLGVKYVGAAWIPHQGPFTMDLALSTAETFNTIGKAVAAQGLRFYYHNHGYEFQPCLAGTLLDVLIQKTDPSYVTFQMDILWTLFPGQDPAALLLKYPGRWELMHLKDLRKGVKGDLSGGTDVRNDVTLGTGQMDFPAVLKAAQASGVKWYFIEDESPSVEQQVPQSLKFLEQVDW